MKGILKISFLLTILIITGACNSNSKSVNTSSKPPTISKEKAVSVFKDLLRTEPISCLVTTLDGKEYIICIAEKKGADGNSGEFIFYKLSQFANSWRVDTQKPVLGYEFENWSFDSKSFEIVKIDNKDYLYFLYESSPMGNAVSLTSVDFSLFSLTDYMLTSLNYTIDGFEGGRGEFSNLEELVSKPGLLRYLEEKAKKYSYIYRPTEKDLDINNVDNFEDKWEVDNSNAVKVWDATKSTPPQNLKLTYYNKSIFPDQLNGEPLIENARFKIISMFRGSVLGYDKKKNQYFPIWVENCSHGCNKDIAFINDTTLEITYMEAQNQKIIINLSDMTYEFILN